MPNIILLNTESFYQNRDIVRRRDIVANQTQKKKKKGRRKEGRKEKFQKILKSTDGLFSFFFFLFFSFEQ